VPDGLYQRYLAAAQAHREHSSTCTQCTDTARCPEGEAVYAQFARLQDDYITRQRRKQRP
jgi:hypothetical protein